MKNGRQETIRYIIEREFLAKITVAELVNRIIQTHAQEQTKKKLFLREKALENSLLCSKIRSREAVER